jgi:hypothetical protein
MACAVLFGKQQQGGLLGIAPLFGPLAPVWLLLAAATLGLQGFEAAVVFQGFAAAVAERLKVLSQRVLAVQKSS